MKPSMLKIKTAEISNWWKTNNRKKKPSSRVN